MKRVINDRSISDTQMESLLGIAKNVNSDHYMTEILKQMMDNRELNAQNTQRVISLSGSVQSDHYKTEILKKVIKEKNTAGISL